MKQPIPSHIFVGSTNPVKINAVKQAVMSWSKVTVQDVTVASGVAGQPLTDEETRLGAQQRAKAAWEEGKKQIETNSDANKSLILGIGLEGGVYRLKNQLWSTVWVAVTADGTRFFESNGARFCLPEAIAQPILEGQEMGDVLKEMFGGENIRQQQGGIGIVTENFVDRTEEYAAIAKLAIGLWFGQDWQSEQSGNSEMLNQVQHDEVVKDPRS